MVRLGGHLGPIIPTAWATILSDAILGLSGQSCVNLGAILDHRGVSRRLENVDFAREVHRKCQDDDEYVFLLFHFLSFQALLT